MVPDMVKMQNADYLYNFLIQKLKCHFGTKSTNERKFTSHEIDLLTL